MSETSYTEYRIWFLLGSVGSDWVTVEQKVWERTRDPDSVEKILEEGKRTWSSPAWGVQEVLVRESADPIRWDRGSSPFEVWRILAGDVIRVEGLVPPEVTVTETGYGGPAHERIEWEAGQGKHRRRGTWKLPRSLAVELVASERNAVWVPGSQQEKSAQEVDTSQPRR